MAAEPVAGAARPLAAAVPGAARGAAPDEPKTPAEAEAPDRPDGAIGPAGARAWPVTGGVPVPGRSGAGGRPVVLRGWEPPAGPYAAGHRGVDLSARPGAPVRAAAAGRVAFAGQVAGRGVVTVELTGTGEPPLRITYQPVRARAAKGDRVAAGDEVGVLAEGPFHCAGGCLHWGLLRGDDYLDPLRLLPDWMLLGGRSRLLPVRGVPEPEPGDAAGVSPGRPGAPWRPPPP